MGRLQGRSVVHAVTGHRHDFAVRFERIDDAELLFRHDTGKHPDILYPGGEFGVRHAVQFGAGDDAMAVGDSGLARNRQRRGRIVAGDHDDLDTGGAAFGDGGRHGIPERILESQEADAAQFQIMVSIRQIAHFRSRLGDGQHPQAAGRHFDDARLHCAGFGVAHVAQVGDGLRRAFRGDDQHPVGASPRVTDSRQFGRQRVFTDKRPVGMKMFGIAEKPDADLVKGAFHGVERVLAAGKNRVFDQVVHVLGQAVGLVCDVDDVIPDTKHPERHPVPRQRAGLIDTKDGRRAQGFNGRHPPGKHVAP